MITKERAKELRIKRLFNLTMDEYNWLGNRCMICGRVGKKKEISVDHEHKTGLIRGRACMRCNRGLALFGDDPMLLDLASEYLRNPPAVQLLGERFGRTGRVNKKVKKNKSK
jgi:hypothetical protein